VVGEVRRSNGRSATTSFLIIDSQSVKNTDTAEEKGYDAGKTQRAAEPKYRASSVI